MEDDHTSMEEHEEFSTDELVQVTEDKVDALINLLIKKGLISESELEDALGELYEDSDEDSDEDDSDEDDDSGY